MKTISIIVLNVLLSFFSNHAIAKINIMPTRDIFVDFGKIYISPDQPVSSSEAIYKKSVFIQSPCSSTNTCRLTTIVEGTNGHRPPGTMYIEKLGNTGLSVGIRFANSVSGSPNGLSPLVKPEYEISIFKTSEPLQSGTININNYVLYLEYYNASEGFSRSYNIFAQAQINTGSCILNTKNLSFKLPLISSSEVDKLSLGKIENKQVSNTLLAKCSGIDEVGFSFNSGDVTSDSSVLNGKLSNGKDSGLGFMLFYRLSDGSEYPVKWDGSSLINIKNPTDISIPFTAFYAKTSNILNPGNINATGTFTISYR